MSNTDTPGKADIICPCSGTRRQRVIDLIDSGVHSLEQISRKTGAVSGCGSCEWDIKELLEQHHNP